MKPETRISLAKAKSIAIDKAYELTRLDKSHENSPVIVDGFTKEFEWGFLFYYEGKKALAEENEEFRYFIKFPILVDRYTSEAIEIYTKFRILDSELEKYRKSKGYNTIIKFPIERDISEMPILKQVKILFSSKELQQIRMGLDLIITNKLADIKLLERIVYNNCFTEFTFEENLLDVFSNDMVVLNSAIGTEFPSDLKLFSEFKRMNLSGVNLNSISSEILVMKQLESIEIWVSCIEKITPDIQKLEKLNHIHIWDSKLGTQARDVLKYISKIRGIELIEH